MKEQVHDVGVAALKVAPPAAVAAASAIGGLTLQEWVYVVTIIYVVAQTAYLLFKWYRDFRGGGPE